ncbi:hypothetical protein SAMN06296378_0921 [Salinibacterium xinjiangense]|uniref:Uncharacterized protein n=1 Tax=Salinibacterium xinjiangense TaxID=386302 RepID=A0A2C8Z697_9MICO|nr:hypothetical protein SAMN06296378_0921 [Salinibacterium xinjiangense]
MLLRRYTAVGDGIRAKAAGGRMTLLLDPFGLRAFISAASAVWLGAISSTSRRYSCSLSRYSSIRMVAVAA